MVNLPPLSQYPTCTKCGSRNADCKYDFYIYFGTLHEFMKRTCKACGYEWKEAPLDADKRGK